MNTTTLNMTTLDGGVIIKKETAPAPPSGGESGWEYYDVRTMEDKLMIAEFIGFAPYVLCGVAEYGAIYYGVQDAMLNLSYLRENPDKFLGIGYCMENRITTISNGEKTEIISGEYIKDWVEMMGFDPFADAIRITKEEFYNLD